MVYEELQRLEKISEHIIRKVKMLERENEGLINELNACQIELKEKDEELKYFKNQIKISKIVKNIPVGNKDSAELRDKIDNYINEIDKIIAHLSE
jgi:DNA repair exonuclease SbcCD ATPase subunit